MKRVQKLRCGRCDCFVGPGFYEREVWWDPAIRRPICRFCAAWQKVAECWLVAEADEVAGLGIAELSRLIEQRVRRQKTHGP